MNESNFREFTALLDDVYSLHGRTLQATAKAMFFRALAPYSIEAVRAGLDGHVRDPNRGQYPPKPADVIAQILGHVADDGRPGAEEAWAIACTAGDERETVVWTSETALAFAIARPVLESGDEVAARMAFKEAYLRLVSQARLSGTPASWRAELGWDSGRREKALTDAVEFNRLPPSAVAAMLPAPQMVLAIEYGTPSEQAKAEANLMRVKTLLSTLPSQAEKMERAQARRRDRELEKLREMKAQSARRVAEHRGAA